MTNLLVKSEFSNLYHNLTYSLMSSISGHVHFILRIAFAAQGLSGEDSDELNSFDFNISLNECSPKGFG